MFNWKAAGAIEGKKGQDTGYTYIIGTGSEEHTGRIIHIYLSGEDFVDTHHKSDDVWQENERVPISHRIDMHTLLYLNALNVDSGAHECQKPLIGIMTGEECINAAITNRFSQGENNVNILVNCTLGLERSVSAVMFHLVTHHPNCKNPFEVVATAVRNRRGEANYQQYFGESSKSKHILNLRQLLASDGSKEQQKKHQAFQYSIGLANRALGEEGKDIVSKWSGVASGEAGETIYRIVQAPCFGTQKTRTKNLAKALLGENIESLDEQPKQKRKPSSGEKPAKEQKGKKQVL